VCQHSRALWVALSRYLRREAGSDVPYLTVGNETCVIVSDLLKLGQSSRKIPVVAIYIEGLADAAPCRVIAPCKERPGNNCRLNIRAIRGFGQKATPRHTGKIAPRRIYTDV